MDRNHSQPCLELNRFDAAVFDLDGIITRTADLHAAAWKAMFDDYLKQRSGPGQFRPFDRHGDYRRYVDGKPRYEGVRSFLESRAIELPDGRPEDGPDQETIYGLGQRKNRLFLDLLRHQGVEVYSSTLQFIRRLRQAGLGIAVVSSSRNCAAVLEAADVADLFDARVDGRDLQRDALAGKPAPDMFREAARRLAIAPHRCLGIEDATAGVAAAHAAGYAHVIGVDRAGQAKDLREHGADTVVEDLGEVVLCADHSDKPHPALPSALDSLDRIVPDADGDVALFLDFDGTLTPIVSQPDQAALSTTMRTTLQHLAGLCELAVISGRDLADVRRRMGIEGIWYAGSHGFELTGPGGQHDEYQEGGAYLPKLDQAQRQLNDQIGDIQGCLVERKRFAIAVHYRQVDNDDAVNEIKQTVKQIHSAVEGLRLSTGKMILELRPDIDWDKGKALHWLMQMMDLDPARFRPIYLGDDVTDEDAFREIKGEGVGILVAPADQPTRARYRLADVDAVQTFLQRFGQRLESQSK
ncbi:hypothetical protein Tel_12725 [Candidatus Tenderia electrophaga]|jgi:alpha,alpha-trehalase|uniref:Trehalose 6-phosphate phosphatase n=1 Tax=Candidatus Tenderia electrophaga TaxID=1748243 RepID=A0A0S2TFL2_9GAMM|nr:hypothetical protein Tel_12725 [Candidatus Tenderia electrophaga]